jgi:hypothetical protein
MYYRRVQVTNLMWFFSHISRGSSDPLFLYL